MPHNYDEFDESAQEVLSLAEGEGRRLGHRSIGTEHILLGLALSKNFLLHRAGITTDEFHELIRLPSNTGDVPRPARP